MVFYECEDATAKDTVDAAAPQMLEEPVAPIPQFLEETDEVTQFSPQEYPSVRMVELISERTQTVDAAVPHVLEEVQERISERMHEQKVRTRLPSMVETPQIYYIDKGVNLPVVLQ